MGPAEPGQRFAAHAGLTELAASAAGKTRKVTLMEERNSVGTFAPEDQIQRFRKAVAEMEREEDERRARSKDLDETAVALSAMQRQIASLALEVRSTRNAPPVPRGLIQQSASFVSRPLTANEQKRRPKRTRMWK